MMSTKGISSQTLTTDLNSRPKEARRTRDLGWVVREPGVRRLAVVRPGSQIPAHCQATHENHAAENGSDLSMHPQMVSQDPPWPPFTALGASSNAHQRFRWQGTSQEPPSSGEALRPNCGSGVRLASSQARFFPSCLSFGWLWLLCLLGPVPPIFLRLGPFTLSQVTDRVSRLVTLNHTPPALALDSLCPALTPRCFRRARSCWRF